MQFDKFLMKEIYLFNLRQTILIPPFRIVNLLRCGDNFSNITILQNSLSHGRLPAFIEPYKDVFRTSQNVIRT